MSGVELKLKRVGLGALALMAGLVALGGCGRVGALDQPAPLFGERAKEDYRAGKASQAAAQRRGVRARNAPGSADAADAATDNAPTTKRDVKDPAQQLTPLSATPLPGSVSDPRGAPPSLTPP